MGSEKNKKFGNLVGWIGLVITILVIFAGLIATLTKSEVTGTLASETKEKVEIIQKVLSDHETAIKVIQSQLTEIQKWQERVEKKFDKVLERIK